MLATTNAEEELLQRNSEVRFAATSAAFKQMQFYRRQRKDILQRLIKEKKEYIEMLKDKIAEIGAAAPVATQHS
jgi:L-lactate utilization protein LutB